MLTTSDLKERLRAVINRCEKYSMTEDIGHSLRAILRDLDAAPPKPEPEDQDAKDMKTLKSVIHRLTPAGPPKPTGEQLKHISCNGCCHDKVLRQASEQDITACETCKIMTYRNWTPKEPEPVAQKAIRVPGFGYIPKGVEPVVKKNFTAVEPKAEPGLVSYPIIGGKGNELWLVQRPAGAIALYKVVGRKDFAYIETEIGDKFISLQAFDDPPVKCWFRK